MNNQSSNDRSGILNQNIDLTKATKAFQRAIYLDPDHELVFTSVLRIIQKMQKTYLANENLTSPSR